MPGSKGNGESEKGMDDPDCYIAVAIRLIAPQKCPSPNSRKL